MFPTKETLLSPGARRLRVWGGRAILTEDDAERFSVLSAVRQGAFQASLFRQDFVRYIFAVMV